MRRRAVFGFVTVLVLLPSLALSELLRRAADYPFGDRFVALAVLGSTVTSALAFITARLVLHRGVARPTMQIEDRLATLAAGDPATTAPLAMTGNVEVDRLVRACNSLLERTRLDSAEAEATRVRFRRAITRVGEALASSTDRGAVLDVVLEVSLLVARGRTGVFWLPRTDGLVARFVHGVGADDVTGAELARGEGLAGWVASHDYGQVLASADRLAAVEPVEPCAMAVPVHSRGRLFGVVAVYGRDPGAGRFLDDDLLSLEALMAQAEGAVENTFLHEEASHGSVTDGLTGLGNRRHLDRRLLEEVARHERTEEPFAVVLLDIDDLKPINDQWGHLVGDAVLIEVAARLSAMTRRTDFVARHGGDEFAVVLPNTEPDGGYRMAAKLRTEVAARPVLVPGSGAAIDVSVSVGVATCPNNGTEPRALLGAADAALYRAKDEGKNRVVVAS